MTLATVVKLVLVMLLWAACYPLITAGLGLAPHLTFAAMRAIMAGLALTALALALRRPLPATFRHWALLTVVGLGATSLGFLGMFHAAEFVAPGIATVIANTQPLLAALLAGLFLDEPLTARGMTGLVLGFIGILGLTLPGLAGMGQQTYMIGFAYITLATLGITISNLVLKSLATTLDPLMTMGLQTLIGSVPLVIVALGTEDPTAVTWSPAFLGILVALALFGTAVASWLWLSVLVDTPLNSAVAFSFLTPIFGLLAGAVFFAETLAWWQLPGIGLVILAVALVSWGGTKPVTGAAG